MPQECEVLDWLRPRLKDESQGELLGQGYQAAILLYRTPVGDVVVKRPRGSALSRYLGARAIRHEHEAYRRLADISGVPRAYGLLHEQYLVLEHVPGASLRERDGEIADREAFFGRLLETLQAMHRAGVAHGDLKRKDNVLVGPGERPYLIDFGIAWLEKTPRRWLNAAVFDWYKQADYNAWTKLKYRRRFAELSPDDAARYRPLLIERIARWIRIPYQKLTLRRWRKRRRAQSVRQ